MVKDENGKGENEGPERAQLKMVSLKNALMSGTTHIFAYEPVLFCKLSTSV